MSDEIGNNKDLRRKVFRVSPEFIIALLEEGAHHYLIEQGFPATVKKPLCTQFDIDRGEIGILVEDESFAPVPEGALYPRLDVAAKSLSIWDANLVIEDVVVLRAPVGDIELRQGDNSIRISLFQVDAVVDRIKELLKDA